MKLYLYGMNIGPARMIELPSEIDNQFMYQLPHLLYVNAY